MTSQKKAEVTELLLQVKDAILAHPEAYDQHEWCGTACCIAGHIAAAKGKSVKDSMVVNDFGQHQAVGSYASEVLGHAHYDYPWIFSAEFNGRSAPVVPGEPIISAFRGAQAIDKYIAELA